MNSELQHLSSEKVVTGPLAFLHIGTWSKYDKVAGVT